ncbi:MAG: extracellular solute-binding protein [Candidatus Caldatribacteriaceae bacterium]
MVRNGYTPRDIVNVSGQGDVTQWFINAEVATMVNGNWEFGWHLTEDVMQQLGDAEVATLPVPKEGMKPVVPFGGECFGIISNIDPAKYDVAWEFLKIMGSSDTMLQANIKHGGLPTRASAAEKILAANPFSDLFWSRLNMLSHGRWWVVSINILMSHPQCG